MVRNIAETTTCRKVACALLQLVDKLAAIGVVDSEPNIRNKLARGKFTAVFLIQCLEAIGVRELNL
ncbi:hypothetical protein DF286_12745 [Sphingosinicella humi]|uniref:DUF6471 domain-containing protein n=1 Tax=Allosphingosinicella humi TaxID=2068657 RepID=A0A2U2J6P2_9SPHN|nr:hypothetical protein DF286_12745 [Sphingosinicella humi]